MPFSALVNKRSKQTLVVGFVEGTVGDEDKERELEWKVLKHSWVRRQRKGIEVKGIKVILHSVLTKLALHFNPKPWVGNF